jgi:hypothetical protein
MEQLDRTDAGVTRFRRDAQRLGLIKTQIDVSVGSKPDTYDVVVRSAFPPGAALWHGTVHDPLTAAEEAELDWAAGGARFDQRTVKWQIRDAIRQPAAKDDNATPEAQESEHRTFRRS